MKKRSDYLEIEDDVKSSSPGPDGEQDSGGLLVRVIFYYIGMTLMFPYMMLITLTDFWNYKFRNTSLPWNASATVLTEKQTQFPGYIAITGNAPLALFVILTAIFGYKIHLKMRLLLCAVGMSLCYIGIQVMVSLDSHTFQDVLFIMILVLNTIYSSINAIAQTSFLGNIGRFPAAYIGSANDGIGLGGILPAVISIIILGSEAPPWLVGVVAVSCSLLTLVMLVPSLLAATATPFYKHHAYGDETAWSLGDYSNVLSRTWLHVLVTILVFGQTLTLHPAVTALVESSSQEHNLWTDKFFLPVTCFLVQAVCDWLGRSLATYSQWPKPGLLAKWLLGTLTILRFGFLPLIMACNVLPGRRTTDVVFSQDWAFILIFSTFNILGGFLSNAALMLGPKQVELKLQELAGTMLLFGLVAGLGIGSLFGPILVNSL